MDRWDGGNDYDVFMGRWSALIAHEFVQGLDTDSGLRWLDVGCGTGALLASIMDLAEPGAATGIDSSPEFVRTTRDRLGEGADIRIARGEDLPFDDNTFDAVVSGLVLNFIPDPRAAILEWRRVAQPGGLVGLYVWDYAEGMEFLRYFWDAAVATDASARTLDEAERFPICEPEPLAELFADAGMRSVVVDSITVDTPFTGFDGYWTPFLRGQGPAPSYVASLQEARRHSLREELRSSIPHAPDRSIRLTAKAWMVSGSV